MPKATFFETVTEKKRRFGAGGTGGGARLKEDTGRMGRKLAMAGSAMAELTPGAGQLKCLKETRLSFGGIVLIASWRTSPL